MALVEPSTPRGCAPDEVADAGRATQLGSPLSPGSEVGQYVIEKMIGGGGYGIVYAARHHVLRQRVAIKVLRAELSLSPVLVTRFVREAQAVNRIRHPNIVAIHDFGELAPGRPYYVMELLDGVDLLELTGLHGRFSPSEMLELVAPVCEAIAAAHELGIVHRDIKASNVMISERDGQRSIKLLDFGVAKISCPEVSGPGLTEPGVKLGTTGNMAPEQIRGEEIDARADIYALGVLMYQLLTGEPPFHGTYPQQVAMMHLQAPAPRPSLIAPVSAALDAVVLRCLEKLPERRYQHATSLLAALRDAVGLGQDSPALSSLAVAFYCEVMALSDDGEFDDAMLDDLLAALELCEETLQRDGYVFAMRTSNALLAVRLVGSDAGSGAARSAARATGHELQQLLAARPSAHASLRAALSMTLGAAHYRSSPDGIELVGGPLFDLDSWTAQNRL